MVEPEMKTGPEVGKQKLADKAVFKTSSLHLPFERGGQGMFDISPNQPPCCDALFPTLHGHSVVECLPEYGTTHPQYAGFPTGYPLH